MPEKTAYGHDLRHPLSEVRAAIAAASTVPFWLDDDARPAPRAASSPDASTDLLVIGGGFCGLWTALIAKERHPDRRVLLLEASRIGWAASGRNGGFAEQSLTHGRDNGELHFADELPIIERLAEENFQAFEESLVRHGIDAEWERTGILKVATEPHQVEWLRDAAQRGGTLLTGSALAERGRSPLYRAGLLAEQGYAYVNPARLAWGLAEAAEALGVVICENSPALRLSASGRGPVRVVTPRGSVTASAVALATNAFPSLLPSKRPYTVPIYDYVLVTEPLSARQLDVIGWADRHGVSDSSREFHYYRKTRDNRILFGGFDAIYHRGGRIRAGQDQRSESFERLADHFFSTFPPLRGIRFSHKWGGAIDMSTQLVAFHGVAKHGRVAYSAGYTGLGVVATRFGAETMLDLLEGRETARTRLTMARRLPVPIPPEPLAYPLIQMMRRAVAKSDANEGRDGALLKLAGLFGVGFDS